MNLWIRINAGLGFYCHSRSYQTTWFDG